MRWLLVMTAVACEPAADEDGPVDSDLVPLPLGLPTTAAGATWAGAAVVDLTPAIPETFTDLNGDFTFQGCFDDPLASSDPCMEPFDDANGNGTFDAVFIGGFGPLRPAAGVNDPITARAIVLEDGGAYLGLVVLDFAGLANPRIDAAARRLWEEDGFDPDRLMVLSTHNHQGPDVLGLWGNPEGCIGINQQGCVPGFDEEYQDVVVDGIVAAVRQAAASARAATLTVGTRRMRDLSPYFNGATFGGVNPTAKMHGMVNDIRDPVVVSDQVLAMQAHAGDEVIFTFTSWSGHPEVRGGNNDQLSADWVGAMRTVIEDRYGGVAVHAPESLGGMQSALGGDLPLRDELGAWVWDVCTAQDVANEKAGCEDKAAGAVRTLEGGLDAPVWTPHDSWDFVRSHGWHLADAVTTALEGGVEATAEGLRVEVEDGYVPVRNLAYNLLGPLGIFDLPLTEGTRDLTLCPEAAEVELGCIPFRVFRARIGPVGIASAPGELVPELSWGLPQGDPVWDVEAADPTARGPGSTYFPQHDHDCDTLGWAACRDVMEVGDCDCLSVQAWPYTVGDDPLDRPVLTDLDDEFKAAMSMTSTYLSYILPATTTNTAVSLLTDDGDHYEDTVTPAHDFGRIYLRTWRRLNDRW